MGLFKRDITSSMSKDIAKDRLKFVLIHDRTKVNPEVLGKIKEEMLQVIKKYLDVDMDGCEILLKNDRRNAILEANIPISNKEEL
ncbi:cell division topological specificity factor MinE [Alkalicella caledoniensis]|uniref:Cell division topological specificity factor n=1 Tax=Alkalicella caledoniensis TaxID=2731377 RepID=A0A7G9W4J3_ALKCA|nr:cell division topological specificity factor MinE [Alkalicella caledoniensis]QNO13605.1 cell division topological specificity factor MinE [Alkalicella caledoniensis]